MIIDQFKCLTLKLFLIYFLFRPSLPNSVSNLIGLVDKIVVKIGFFFFFLKERKIKKKMEKKNRKSQVLQDNQYQLFYAN